MKQQQDPQATPATQAIYYLNQFAVDQCEAMPLSSGQPTLAQCQHALRVLQDTLMRNEAELKALKTDADTADAAEEETQDAEHD